MRFAFHLALAMALLVGCAALSLATESEYEPPSTHFILSNPAVKERLVCTLPLENDAARCYVMIPVAKAICLWSGKGQDFACLPDAKNKPADSDEWI